MPITLEQTPQQNILQNLDPEVVEYALSLCQEGLEIRDERAKEEHFGEIAEMLGDIAVYEAVSSRATEMYHETRENITQARAQKDIFIAREIEHTGYFTQAPVFADQVNDKTRQAAFAFRDGAVNKDTLSSDNNESTEQAGLVELQGFLTRFIKEVGDLGETFKYPELLVRAEGMLENLTFIGTPEYNEAAYGIAARWKTYLNDDPKRQICALTCVSNSTKYLGQRKSDDYMRDRVLGTFSDEELKRYSGRIVGELNEIDAAPENVRVVMLDDWSVSGSQLRRAFDELVQDPLFEQFVESESVEVNMLVSSEQRLHNGITMHAYEDKDLKMTQPVLPVRSYFVAHHAGTSQEEHASHVTGLHSSVNFDFVDPIHSMVGTLGRLGKMRQSRAPLALTNVVRPYYDQPSEVMLSKDKLARREEEATS